MTPAQALRPVLPLSMSPRTIAEGCRDAALSFCRNACAGWTKQDLAAWLSGPYATVAGLVDVSVAPQILEVPSSRRPTMPPMARLADEEIAAILEPAWDQAMACVEALSRSHGGAADVLIEDAFTRGSLVEAITVRGEVVIVPMHRPRLRLAARVQSLFIADFLFRSHDYEGELEGCSSCGVVLIGAGARENSLCGAHMRTSGIVASDPDGELTFDVDLSELG